MKKLFFTAILVASFLVHADDGSARKAVLNSLDLQNKYLVSGFSYKITDDDATPGTCTVSYNPQSQTLTFYTVINGVRNKQFIKLNNSAEIKYDEYQELIVQNDGTNLYIGSDASGLGIRAVSMNIGDYKSRIKSSVLCRLDINPKN